MFQFIHLCISACLLMFNQSREWRIRKNPFEYETIVSSLIWWFLSCLSLPSTSAPLEFMPKTDLKKKCFSLCQNCLNAMMEMKWKRKCNHTLSPLIVELLITDNKESTQSNDQSIFVCREISKSVHRVFAVNNSIIISLLDWFLLISISNRFASHFVFQWSSDTAYLVPTTKISSTGYTYNEMEWYTDKWSSELQINSYHCRTLHNMYVRQPMVQLENEWQL